MENKTMEWQQIGGWGESVQHPASNKGATMRLMVTSISLTYYCVIVCFECGMAKRGHLPISTTAALHFVLWQEHR